MALSDKDFEFGRKVIALRVVDRHFRNERGAIARARRLYVEDGQSTRSLIVYGDTAYTWALDAHQRSKRRFILGVFASLERTSALGIIKDLEDKISTALLRPETTAEQCERFAAWFQAVSRVHFPASDTERKEYWYRAFDCVNCGIGTIREGEAASASTHPKLRITAAELHVDRPHQYPNEYGKHLDRAIELVRQIPDVREAAPLYERIGILYSRLGDESEAARWFAEAEEASGE